MHDVHMLTWDLHVRNGNGTTHRSLMRKREAEASGKTVVQKPKFAQDDSESEDESEDEDDALDWRKRGL